MADKTILIADDEPELAELYSEFLADRFTVRTATDGEEALKKIDEEVDLAILDRRMPHLSGDEVLEIIRSHGFDIPVIMVTAVSPDFDIVSMSFNDYLTKPVSAVELQDRVEILLRLSSRDVQVQEYLALLAKQRALKEEKDDATLETSDEYATLQARLRELQNRIDPPLSERDGLLVERFNDLDPESLSF